MIDRLLGRLVPFHLVLDGGLRIVDAGPSMRRLLGDGIVGQPMLEVLEVTLTGDPGPLGDAAVLATMVERQLTCQARTHPLRLRAQLLDAEEGRLVLAATPILDRGSSFSGALSPDLAAPHEGWADAFFVTQLVELQHRDVERLAAEHQAQAAQFRAVLDAAGDAIIVTDDHGTVQFANHAAEAIFGLEPSSLRGQSVRTLMPAGAAVRHDAAMVAYDGSRRSHSYHGVDLSSVRDVQAVRADGSLFDVELTISPVARPGERQYVAVVRDVSERREMERQLLRRQTELDEAQRVAHVGSYTWDPTADKASWSDEMFRIFGMAPGGQAPAFADHQDRFEACDRDQLLALVTRCLQHGEPFEVPVTILQAGGEARRCVARGEAFNGPHGERHLRGTLTDVTELLAVQAALRASEERFAAVVDAVQDSILVLRPVLGPDGLAEDLVIEWGNAAWRSRIGIEGDEYVGRRAFEVGPPFRALLPLYRRVLATGVAESADVDFGDGRWSDVSFTRFGDRLLAVARDVTDRKRSEQSIEEARFELAEAQRIGHVGSWQYEPATDAWTWSDEVFRVLGLEPGRAEASWQQLALHLSERATRELPAALQALRNAGEPLEVEVEAKRPDATVRRLFVRGERADVPGRGTVLRGSISDVTDLRAAQAAAEAASEAKSMILANVSHEIRTPMVGVVGMMSLLRGTPLTDDQVELVETARTSANALLALIGDLIDYGRIEAGKLTLETAPYEPRDLIENVLAVVQPRAQVKGITLAFVADPAMAATVMGDASRVRQIVLNLVDNAVKFTSAGEVVVRVAADGDRLRLEVSDTGIGIAPEALPRLFASFEQGDRSRTREFGGTGLGLAISRRLAEAMGGTLTVTSEAGRGSRFTLLLPLQAAGQPPTRPLDGVEIAVVAPDGLAREELESVVRDLGGQLVPQDAAALVVVRGPGGGASAAGARRRSEVPVIYYVERDAMGAPAPGSRWLHLPLRRRKLSRAAAELLGRPASHALDPLPPTPMGPVARLRVLIAEDNPVNRRVARLQLERLGHTADTVENGQEALEALAAGPYDLLLLDLHMPVLDGLQTVHRVRERERALGGVRLPVVALTANVLPEERARCLAAGMDDYLSKPVDDEALARCLISLAIPAPARRQ